MEWTIKSTAKMFNVPESTVYKWMEHSDLPSVRVQGRYRFNKTELLEWATAHGIPVSAEFAASGPDHAGTGALIFNAVKTGGIFYDVAGKKMESVLKTAVKKMRLPGATDRKFLLDMLLAREALGSTGIGDGVAIPHPRTPIVLNVDRPVVTILFLADPVDFGAVDGKPVHTLFLMISPTVQIHLQLLSRLAFLLHQPALKKRLRNRDSEELILDEILRLETAFKRPPGHGKASS
jgi:PTS system nitrogen regulatory IIA component